MVGSLLLSAVFIQNKNVFLVSIEFCSEVWTGLDESSYNALCQIKWAFT